ncbi:MAG TPA: glycosyltransferase family 4 protein [Dysgonamonadaceae bacterium]|nr:glycosyltransferase family 4 protein [Dysgonamonadaceae bacterium]
MKVLIVSTSDLQGGAAIAAYRLLNALTKAGIDARMAVRDKQSANNLVVKIGSDRRNKLNFYRERADIFIRNRFSRQTLFDVSIANTGISITDLPEFRDADVVHLHWINQGMLSLHEIGKIIASGKKIVWTMHDMWPFTGICHHAGSCSNFKKACGSCPYLGSHSSRDLSRHVFLQKQATYAKGKITFVACSHWLQSLAEKSPLTKGHNVVSIPNPIDTDIYRPKDKIAARNKLNLPIDKKIVLFAAVKASDKRKGTDYLIEASRLMAQRNNDIHFLIAGNRSDEIEQQLALPAHSTGYVSPENMPDIYNAADVFVTPSLQENLPNTIMEAMSCGTPCVGFEIGGIPEMIDHKQNGYVARYKVVEDLAEGLCRILESDETETLSANAREKALSSYSENIVVQNYLELYGSL